MKNKILYSLLLIFLSLFLFGCQDQNSSTINKRDGKMPIVTTNETIAIHTRMIAGDRAFVVALEENARPSAPEKELIYDAGVIISDFPIAGSHLEKTLQKYTGTYLNISPLVDKQSALKMADVISEIEKIRNTLSELDPVNTGSYYDNAGVYIHLLQDTYSKLNLRLTEYNKVPFILVGPSMDEFLESFGLRKYLLSRFDNFNNVSELVSEISALQKQNHFTTLIAYETPSKYIVDMLKKKFGIRIYVLPKIEEDTSGWGYLRFIEKRINTFIQAFDTFD